jgi:predicted CopG family antitoxin
MTSKTISITNEIYEELQQIKQNKESFSQLFARMIELHRQNLERSFGAWKMSDDDVEEFWGLTKNRKGRKWNHQNLGEIA